MMKALICLLTDPTVFKGPVVLRATILINQALLSGHEAFCAKGNVQRGYGADKGKLFFRCEG
ncbi:hypothetical protein E3Y94_21670 [Escherichia albertii]|nr:hypothetical protein [Escherichia albertii]EFA7087646.1 hypothetical protein [Escherichia albertii]QTA16022.1 hypothetical protein FYK19_09115 [Escherichia albertii]